MKARVPAAAVLAAILWSTVLVYAQRQAQTASRPNAIELSNLPVKVTVPIDYSKPVRVTGGVAAANLEHKVYPAFPPRTNCLRLNGAVVMHVIIGKNGHVESAEAISGPEVMRQPNVNAAKQEIYRPFQLYGHPVEVETMLTRTVNFNRHVCSDR